MNERAYRLVVHWSTMTPSAHQYRTLKTVQAVAESIRALHPRVKVTIEHFNGTTWEEVKPNDSL